MSGRCRGVGDDLTLLFISSLKAFKEQVETLVTITRKTVESVHTMIARQNAFTQSIDVMSTNMKELMETTKKMNYKSLKVDDKMLQDNDTISKILESTSKACDSWFFAADFIPNRGGRALGDEMEFVLLQTEGLQELFERRWQYLVGFSLNRSFVDTLCGHLAQEGRCALRGAREQAQGKQGERSQGASRGRRGILNCS